MTREEALAKGFLEKRKVILKPVPRKGKMINDPAHKGFFMYEGAGISFTLPKDSRNSLVNPFNSVEEQKYFEEEMSEDLNIHKKDDNFWKTFAVKFVKTPLTIQTGMDFDLSDPLDNLRVKVLQRCPEVAPSWELRKNKPYYKFALANEDLEEEEQNKELEQMQKMFTFYGTIQNHPDKMKDFLNVFYMNTREMKSVPKNASEKFLNAELMRLMKERSEAFIGVMNDESYEMKAFISKALRVGALEKNGVNSYTIPGETVKWTLSEMVQYLQKLKEETDDVYLKIQAQIEMNNKPKSKKASK